MTLSRGLLSNHYCLQYPSPCGYFKCLICWQQLKPRGNDHPMTKLLTAAVCCMAGKNYAKLVCSYSPLPWIIHKKVGSIDYWNHLMVDISSGQHNFEFRSVSRFHSSGGEAGLISISHFTNLPHFFIMRIPLFYISHFMCVWLSFEAGYISHYIVHLSGIEVVRANQFLISLTYKLIVRWGRVHFLFRTLYADCYVRELSHLISHLQNQRVCVIVSDRNSYGWPADQCQIVWTLIFYVITPVTICYTEVGMKLHGKIWRRTLNTMFCAII